MKNFSNVDISRIIEMAWEDRTPFEAIETQFEFLPSIMMEAMALSIVAAILAGIYPGYKMSKTSPANALREE